MSGNRQIFVDTETTGLEVEQGHRIVELGCVLAEHRKITEQQFQRYFNPGMRLSAEAIKVHGLEDEFLQQQGVFADSAQDFIEFIKGAELIMHNAPFDTSFIDMELKQAGYEPLANYCAEITDNLALARELHTGQSNSLSALCKRYDIDDSGRVKHGALLDASLLAEVYFAMTSGQSDMVLDVPGQKGGGSVAVNMAKLQENTAAVAGAAAAGAARESGHCLVRLTDDELKEHEAMLRRIKSASGKCLLED